MWWEFIINKYSYFKQKKTHFLFPLFTGALGGWMGMLLTPTIGAIFIAASLYLAFVVFIPWDKISQFKFKWKKLRWKPHYEYCIPAVITLLIIVPIWGKLVSIFPSNDPYKQLLKTGEANIEVTVDPNGVMEGGLRSFAGLCVISLVKNNDLILEMNVAAARQPLENGQVRFWAKPELNLNDISINKPIYQIAKAEVAIIWIEKLPPKSNVLKGQVILTFNSSVRIEIPIPPQTMKDDVIIISDIQKYFKQKKCD